MTTWNRQQLLELLRDAEDVLTEDHWHSEEDRLAGFAMIADRLAGCLRAHGLTTIREERETQEAANREASGRATSPPLRRSLDWSE